MDRLQREHDAFRTKFERPKEIRLVKNLITGEIKTFDLSKMERVDRVAHRILVFLNPDRKIVTRNGAARYTFRTLRRMKDAYVRKAGQIQKLLDANVKGSVIAGEPCRLAELGEAFKTAGKVANIKGLAPITARTAFHRKRSKKGDVTVWKAQQMYAAQVQKASVGVEMTLKNRLPSLIEQMADPNSEAHLLLSTISPLYPEFKIPDRVESAIRQYQEELGTPDYDTSKVATFLQRAREMPVSMGGFRGALSDFRDHIRETAVEREWLVNEQLFLVEKRLQAKRANTTAAREVSLLLDNIGQQASALNNRLHAMLVPMEILDQLRGQALGLRRLEEAVRKYDQVISEDFRRAFAELKTVVILNRHEKIQREKAIADLKTLKEKLLQAVEVASLIKTGDSALKLGAEIAAFVKFPSRIKLENLKKQSPNQTLKTQLSRFLMRSQTIPPEPDSEEIKRSVAAFRRVPVVSLKIAGRFGPKLREAQNVEEMRAALKILDDKRVDAAIRKEVREMSLRLGQVKEVADQASNELKEWTEKIDEAKTRLRSALQADRLCDKFGIVPRARPEVARSTGDQQRQSAPPQLENIDRKIRDFLELKAVSDPDFFFGWMDNVQKNAPGYFEKLYPNWALA